MPGTVKFSMRLNQLALSLTTQKNNSPVQWKHSAAHIRNCLRKSMAAPDKMPLHHAFDKERREVVDAEAEMLKIQAEMDLLRPTYLSAKSVLNDANKSASFDLGQK